jgi:hypothetical protein
MSSAILKSDYAEPSRPYSRNELKDIQNKTYKNLRISKTQARHNKCKHFYFVRENGRKQKEMIENESEDCGNCSVCWKISKTPRELKAAANCLVDTYCNTFYEEPETLIHPIVYLESSFYSWLYLD